MYRQTVVALPAAVTEDEDVREWLEENAERWSHALDLEVLHIDPRTNLIGHDIDLVTVDDGQVNVQYTVEYYIYYGCRDIDGGGYDHRDISGEVVNGTIVFQTFEQPEPLAPDEEL
ncbi:hypothetical protein [Stenotrophomonas lactitubi]|uniref:hypothetical protein n=1 Tax=Stenotrophomonas lactitubi TaxID=2045214 RepID=UPI00203AE90A|nr:hypothetical protein [Stenotrophomonas lactitubi]